MQKPFSPLAVASLVAAVAAACPSTPPPVIAEGEGEGAEGEGEGESDGCIQVEVGPIQFSYKDDVSTHYAFPITSPLDGEADDFLVLQFFNYNERIGELGKGTFALDDATNDNYGHCAECLMVFADQVSETAAPSRVFFQSGGTITVEENPREVADMKGSINGLKLVESTIGGESLESAPVPGGDCIEVADISFDFHFVPFAWTCDPEAYDDDENVCDCNCGDVDVDCFVDLGQPAPVTTGCNDGEVCLLDECLVACDVLGDVGCDAGGLCTYQDPVDVCRDTSSLDNAALGQACGAEEHQFCAAEGTLPRGACEIDVDFDGVRLCRPLCGSSADCAEDEFCFNIAGGTADGQGRGYCAPDEDNPNP